MGLNFTEFAARIAHQGGSQLMLPVIEKELLHYEMLDVLDRARLLDDLTFQGGTCLRLCYGAVRYSEDLDFAGGYGFDFESIAHIKDALEASLGTRYDIELSVAERPAKLGDAGVAVKRWQVKVVTAPARPDIPMQRISLEVASVPAHSRKVRSLVVNYQELPTSYDNVLLHVESLEEICADKLKAYLTAGHLRYRDLWDMRWIIHRPAFDRAALPMLFQEKLHDYGQEKVARQNASRILEIAEVVESKNFLDQMRRFLPAKIIEETIARPLFRESMAAELVELYESVL